MLPEELLTLEEVQKLIAALKNPRDRAIVAILFDSGLRISELAGVQIKNILFDERGAVLNVNGKTGARRVRLIFSTKYLVQWLEYHPNKDNSEAPLWPRLTHRWKGQLLKYQHFRMMLAKAAKAIGLKKRVNPHSFRHAAATRLAKLGMSELQMSAHLGWVPSTKMASVYVSLAGSDVDNALLKAHGIEIKEVQGDRLLCPKCSFSNHINVNFCSKCGSPLSVKAAFEAEDTQIELINHVEKLLQIIDNDDNLKETIKQKLKDAT